MRSALIMVLCASAAALAATCLEYTADHADELDRGAAAPVMEGNP